MERKRNNFIDIIKGLTIFFMIWGHSIQFMMVDSNVNYFANPVYKFIYSFHMPLFMLVSGYLFYFSFNKRNLKTLVFHRGKSMLQPIIFCSIANYLLSYVLIYILKGDIKSIFSFDSIVSAFSNLWFLWAVFFASIIVAIVCKSTNSLFKQLVFLALGGVLLLLLHNYDCLLFMYPYFIIGFYFAKYKNNIKEKAKKIISLSSIVLFPIMLLFYNEADFIYTTGLFDKENMLKQFGIDIYRYVIGFVGCVFIITVVKFMIKLLEKVKMFSSLEKSLCYMGKNSLQFYSIQVLVFFWVKQMIEKILVPMFNNVNILVSNSFLYTFLITPMFAVAICFAIYVVILILNKIKLNKLLFAR